MRSDRSIVREYRLLPTYFLLAFGFSWLFWLPLALSQLGVLSLRIPAVLFWIGGAGPLFAATLLTWASLGARAVVELYSRLLLWRVNWGWYVAALFWPGAIAAIALVAAHLFGIPAVPRLAPLTPILSSIVLTSLLLIVEEVGWRGYALPRLQFRHNALTAAVVLGVLWGPWHFPLHLMPNYPAPLANPLASIALFTVFTVLFSIVLTWIFNSTRGSLLLAVLAHQAFNTTNLRVLAVEPPGPFMMLGFVMLAIFAALLIFVFGAKGLSRRRKVTVFDVHPSLEARQSSV